jgi:hypothetical protein
MAGRYWRREGMSVSADDFQTWIDEQLHTLIVDKHRSVPDLLKAYDELEGGALRLLGAKGDDQGTIDWQREFASLRLVSAHQRGVDAVTGRMLFERSQALGYRSSDLRLNSAAVFARICLANGQPDFEHGELDAALLEVPAGKYPSIAQLADELKRAKEMVRGR